VRITRNPSADGAKTNLVVATGPETLDREGLVLSGHMDVVPAGGPGWRSDPFAMHEAGDRYVGRGTADMKGFLALAANRLAPAAKAVVALAALRRTMEAERPPNAQVFAAVPFAALNVGTISGGSAANVIPDRCEVQLGIRFLPGMTADEMAERVLAAVQGVVEEPVTLEPLSESPAMMLDADAPIHRTLCEAVGQREPHSVMFSSDAGWLQRVGFDCVLLGPGNIEVAHQPNEFLPVAEFRRAGTILDALIRRSCARA